MRQAIELALDKQNYVDTLYGKGNAIAAVNPYPSTLLGYNTKLKNRPRIWTSPAPCSRRPVFPKVRCSPSILATAAARPTRTRNSAHN